MPTEAGKTSTASVKSTVANSEAPHTRIPQPLRQPDVEAMNSVPEAVIAPAATGNKNQANLVNVVSHSTRIKFSAKPALSPAAAELTNQIEIAYGPFKGVHPVYPVTCLFPLIHGRDREDLTKSLDRDGQQEPCVMYGSVFLDGRNRVMALNALGRAPKIIQFSDLKTGLTPAAWVMAKNKERRHLTDDQYLAITANYRHWCKAEAAREQAEADAATKSAQGESVKQGDPSDTGANHSKGADKSAASEFPPKPAENAAKRKRGRPPGERSDAEALAKNAKQTRYRAERMLTLRKRSPELATAVQEGRLTLKQAIEQLQQTQSSKKARSDQPEVDRVARAVDRARKMLLKQASQLEANDQAAFWRQVAAVVRDLAAKGKAAA